jgi:hypothetical protein
VLNTVFKEYGPWAGDINTRELGSLVAFETGSVTGYALESTQQRGRMFVAPGDEVYEDQVRPRERLFWTLRRRRAHAAACMRCLRHAHLCRCDGQS